FGVWVDLASLLKHSQGLVEPALPVWSSESRANRVAGRDGTSTGRERSGKVTVRAVRSERRRVFPVNHRTKRAVRRAEPLHPDAPSVDKSGNSPWHDAVIAVTFPPLQFSRGTGQRGVDRG